MSEAASSSPIGVLVLGATGKQGAGVCDALIALGNRFTVYGMSRSAKGGAAKKLAAKGVRIVEGDMTSRNSIEAALKTTHAKYMFILTLMTTKAGEIAAGKAAIDASIAASLEFVVFSSVADADVCYDNIDHFKSKFEIEKLIKASGLRHAILRPVAFLDNFDDPVNNPLKRGFVSGIWRGDLRVKFVACHDIGKAAAKVFADPAAFEKRTITCVSCDVTGHELAAALTAASGEKCRFKQVLPAWLVRILMPEMGHMITYFEEMGYSCTEKDMAEFKQLVPDAVSPEGFFRLKGEWANGEKFGSRPAPSRSLGSSLVTAAAVVAIAGAAYYLFEKSKK